MAENTVRWKRVTLAGFAEERYVVDVRALTFEELHAVLRLARDSDWYGNVDLIVEVASAGVKGGLDALGTGAFTVAIAAREIWLLTLRAIVARAKAICRGAGVQIAMPQIRRYRYDDLATPGMLLHIADTCENFDVEGYMRDMVGNCVADVSVHGRIVSSDEREAWIEKVFDWVAQELLRMHGVDGRLTEKLPETLLPTLAHRFFAANLLFNTLDWIQFRESIYAFNRAVEAATRRSHQLGGLDEQQGSPLITGVPLFFETIMPTRNLPIEIAPQLMYDASETSLKGFSRLQRTTLKRAARAAMLSVKDRVRSYPDQNAIPEVDQQQIAGAVLLAFTRDVSRFPRLVQRACTLYVERFRAHSDRELRQQLERTRRDFRISVRPDTYLLVEGPSDRIYFARFLELLGTDGAYVKVEAREGSSTMTRRGRDLREDAVVSIATVVDADAAKEHAELKRMLRGSTMCDAFMFDSGAVEDQFSNKIHAAALNMTYSEGAIVTADDLAVAGTGAVARLKRLCWTKKNATFDKVAHAKAVARLLDSGDDVPAEARSFALRTIALAKKSSERPKVKSYFALDTKTRERMRRFDEIASAGEKS